MNRPAPDLETARIADATRREEIERIPPNANAPVEFITRSLFRPFQTTKKKGFGIGMFHTKTIVQAHRGHIEVDSEPNRGTTFRVYLPGSVSGDKSESRNPKLRSLTLR